MRCHNLPRCDSCSSRAAGTSQCVSASYGQKQSRASIATKNLLVWKRVQLWPVWKQSCLLRRLLGLVVGLPVVSEACHVSAAVRVACPREGIGDSVPWWSRAVQNRSGVGRLSLDEFVLLCLRFDHVLGCLFLSKFPHYL